MDRYLIKRSRLSAEASRTHTQVLPVGILRNVGTLRSGRGRYIQGCESLNTDCGQRPGITFSDRE
ncbi:unnamed protein product, partial [Ixodes pacificus]